MRNESGALHRLLEPFNSASIDLTRVETRPSRAGAWTYVLFIDFNGHQSSDNVQAALKAVGDQAADLKVLGSYPIGVL
jgi:chorismate mutase/prephenate dehydratase